MRRCLTPLAGIVLAACSGRIVVGDLEPASTSGVGSGSTTAATTGGSPGGTCRLSAVGSDAGFLDFGTTPFGQTAAIGSVSLRNAGDGPCIVSDPYFTNPSFNLLGSQNQTFPLTLDEGSDLFLRVTFTSQTSGVGIYSAALEIPYIDPGHVADGASSLVIELIASVVPNVSGCACQLHVTNSGAGDFSIHPLETPPEFISPIPFANAAQVPCEIESVKVVTFEYTVGFGLSGDEDLSAGVTVPPFSSAIESVDFLQTIPGFFSGILSVTSRAAPALTLALTATVIPAKDGGSNEQTCQIKPILIQNELPFDEVTRAFPSATAFALLSNEGVTTCQVNAPIFLGGTDFAATDPDAGALFIDSTQAAQLPYPITLRPGQALHQDLTFAPALDAGCTQLYSEVVVFQTLDANGNSTFVPITLVGTFAPPGGG